MSKGPRSRVLLLGNPNSGKTTLFNALTGANAKVGNYPGITVEQRSGRLTLPTSGTVDLIDLPGTYSLSARSPEERIATHELIHGSEPSVAVVVVDATVLGRGLYLATQVAEIDTPLVVVVNMIDEAERSGLAIDTAVLSDRLGAEVVTTVASTRRGLVELRLAMDRALAGEERSGIRVPVEGFAEEAVAELGGVLRTAVPTLGPSTRRALSKWALLSTEPDDALGLVTQEAVDRLRSTAEGQGVDLDRDIIEARYRFVDETVALVSPGREGGDDDAPSLSTRLDDVLTHRIWGTVVFLGIVFVIFEALFSWSEPAMGWIEEAISMAQGWTASMLPPGPVQDLVVHGILAGAGNVIVFVPQIAILFLLIGILEDSGYLARAAFVLDRVMGLAGLHGKAFVPLLSGYACAIPAVMATRTIENERDRLITMLVVPLTSCSARLPVYVLLTATVFAPSATVWGLRLGAVVLFMMYALSLVAALLVASVLRRTILRGPRPSLVLELPPYRWPGLQTLLLG
ncbi:MAG: ferrous iron transport protein B, partial [Myxococcales bacterium]|nr:ferrous iron transport protein B [Myxococcales bacterium]